MPDEVTGTFIMPDPRHLFRGISSGEFSMKTSGTSDLSLLFANKNISDFISNFLYLWVAVVLVNN